MISATVKGKVREHLQNWFDSLTGGLERGHRDGLRILAKQALRHRLLFGAMVAVNFIAAFFEGGTIAILSVAVTVLVDQKSAGIWDSAGLIGSFIDKWQNTWGRGGLFLVLVVTAVGAQIAKSGFAFLGKYFSIQLWLRVTEQLQHEMTKQVMSLSYAEVVRFPAGMVSTTINESAKFARLMQVLNTAILALMVFIVYVCLMIAMSIPLTLSALFVVILIGLALTWIIKTLKLLGKRMIAASLETGRLTFEFLQSPRFLRLYDATEHAEKEIFEARREMLQADAKAKSIKAAVGPATDVLAIGGAGLFMIVGYLAAGDKAVSVIPSLLLFVLVLNRMMPKVKEFNNARMEFFNTLPAAKHVADFLRREDKTFTRKGGIRLSELRQEVRFENVGFKYPDSKESALAGVNFRIAKGETVALVGASGTGKSTLADLILGLHDPTDGCILVDGIDLRELDLKDWRRRIGIVDQEVFLLNSSIRDNIAFAGGEYSNEDIVEAARAAHADGFIRAMPEGYDTLVGDRGFRLSGGQQQRVAIARALVRNPDILVLDEATSALDSGSEQIIQQTLKELHHQRTILLIAHRLSTLSHADKIIVLEGGHVVEQGSWEELLNKAGVFANLWSIQSGHSAVG